MIDPSLSFQQQGAGGRKPARQASIKSHFYVCFAILVVLLASLGTFSVSELAKPLEMTLSAVMHMRRVLRPGGCLVLNVSDAVPFDVVRPVVAALAVAFDDVALLAEPSTLRGRRSGNCVLVGATRQLPVPTLQRRAASAPVRARLLAGEALAQFVGGASPPTDDAPLPEPDEALGRGFL